MNLGKHIETAEDVVVVALLAGWSALIVASQLALIKVRQLALGKRG